MISTTRYDDYEEIISALETAGFSEISIYDACGDLEISQTPGSIYFICHKRRHT